MYDVIIKSLKFFCRRFENEADISCMCMVSYPFRSADMNFRYSLRIAYESNFNGSSVIKRSFLSNNLKKIRRNIIRTKRHEFKIATKITLVISPGNCSFGALACSKSVERFSIAFTANLFGFNLYFTCSPKLWSKY